MHSDRLLQSAFGLDTDCLALVGLNQEMTVLTQQTKTPGGKDTRRFKVLRSLDMRLFAGVRVNGDLYIKGP